MQADWMIFVNDGIVFSLSPAVVGGLFRLAVASLILIYAIRIPLKRNHHYLFMVFVATIVLWSVLAFYGQTADNVEAYTERARWTFMLAMAPQYAFLYHSVLHFVSPKLNKPQKFTLFVAYCYVIIINGILMLYPSLLFTRARTTALGYVAGPGSLTPVLNPYGVSISTVIYTVLITTILVRYFRSRRSPLVRAQIRYLLGGYLIYTAGTLQWFGAQYFGGISLLPYLTSGGLVVILFGLSRHGFSAIIPMAEMQSKVPLRYDLPQGSTYLAFEPEPKQSFEVFSNLALNGHYGLCITRSSPSSIRESYGLKITPILWLTEEKVDNTVAPSDLHGLLVTTKAFLQKADRSVMMLHGFEYLVSINGFKPMLRLILRLNDLILQKNGILLIPVVPGTLNEKQQTLLSAECPSLQRLEVSQSGEAITSLFQPRQELHPLLANTPIPTEAHIQEPLQFKREDAAKVFRFLAKAFLQDYTVQRIIIDSAGWRTALEIAGGTGLPTRKMYGRDGGPGQAIVDLLKRGLVETRSVPGQRGRGGTIMKVRANHGNPYVKAEIDRLALKP